jgi:hypothetical protein
MLPSASRQGLGQRLAHSLDNLEHSSGSHACGQSVGAFAARGRLDDCTGLDGGGLPGKRPAMPPHALQVHRAILSRHGATRRDARGRATATRPLCLARSWRGDRPGHRPDVVGYRARLGHFLKVDAIQFLGAGNPKMPLLAFVLWRHWRMVRCRRIAKSARGQTQPIKQVSDESVLSPTAALSCRGRSGG